MLSAADLVYAVRETVQELSVVTCYGGKGAGVSENISRSPSFSSKAQQLLYRSLSLSVGFHSPRQSNWLAIRTPFGLAPSVSTALLSSLARPER